jgi:hypothetical protein
MNDKMVNGVVGGAVVEVDRRESESKGCDVFYPFGLAPPGVDTYVLWCVDRGRHNFNKKTATKKNVIQIFCNKSKSMYLLGCVSTSILLFRCFCSSLQKQCHKYSIKF